MGAYDEVFKVDRGGWEPKRGDEVIAHIPGRNVEAVVKGVGGGCALVEYENRRVGKGSNYTYKFSRQYVEFDKLRPCPLPLTK